jgi:esterase/lipase superfamily enzyme
MQALRFLTDYLQDDVYYGSAFEEQNFIRAGNQFTLLQRYNGLRLVVELLLVTGYWYDFVSGVWEIRV